MPQDVPLFLPFPARDNPDAARARERHLAWVCAHGLIRDPRALRRYRDWLLTDLVGYAYPEARGRDLDLVTDAVCLGFPLDDAFDGELGRHPGRAAVLVAELAAIPHRAPGARPALNTALTRAYADVWRRCARGMSASWRARAADNLARFFRAYLTEARNRRLGVELSERGYVALRRHAVGTAPCFDLIERAGGFEVPQAAWRRREMALLARCAGDVVFLCNDVHSLEREEARGDPHNLVLIRERARGCPRAAALAHVAHLIHRRVTVFQAVAAQLPELCARLGLDAAGHLAVTRYVAGLRAWMAGNQRWGSTSARYAPAGVAGRGGPRRPRGLSRVASAAAAGPAPAAASRATAPATSAG